jgi:hypothetical protein
MIPEPLSNKAKSRFARGFCHFKSNIQDLAAVIKTVRIKTESLSSEFDHPSRVREENDSSNMRTVIKTARIETESPSSEFNHPSRVHEENDPSNMSKILKDDSRLVHGGKIKRIRDRVIKFKAKAGDKTMHTWTNWSGTQTANPAQIIHPKTIDDLVAIILRAKVENKKIRCVGNGFTWSSSSVVQQDGFLVAMKKMDKMYDPVRLEDHIWTVEIETGVQVKELDDFLKRHDPPLALSNNVVMESFRYGGILSLGCHGAATHARTLTDLVHSVKIVDASGTINVFSRDVDPVEFSSATLNLGLLGIIYSYTLRVEPMFQLHVVGLFPMLLDSLPCLFE